MGWIGVDFDGTLVETMPPGKYEYGKHGAPIMLMVDRVNDLLAAGKEVRIMTARANFNNRANVEGQNKDIAMLMKFCLYYFGRSLAFTATKDFEMIELWDDRARQVVVNTGEFAVDVIKAGMK